MCERVVGKNSRLRRRRKPIFKSCMKERKRKKEHFLCLAISALIFPVIASTMAGGAEGNRVRNIPFYVYVGLRLKSA